MSVRRKLNNLIKVIPEIFDWRDALKLRRINNK